jgi:hypothetical protein
LSQISQLVGARQQPGVHGDAAGGAPATSVAA